MTHPNSFTRRGFFGQAGAGVLTGALSSILGKDGIAATGGALDSTHHMPRARRVIHLCMAGGPSHLETLDYKPELARRHGEPMPESFTKGQQLAQLQGAALKCFAPQHAFAQFGESGQEICTLFPKIGSHADKLCIVRSL
ncbi:MAG: DUF1501 domain-containing protein, partial [Planctomycetota bacterium]|nr:DUF1501 domain-containing protein [Planctomycetota bacterium]